MADDTKKPAPHKYKLAYKIEEIDPHPGGLSVEEATARAKEGWGACDAMLITSIIYPSDGSLSVFFIPKDGRTGEDLSDHEMFKVWTLLANRLARSKTLDPVRQLFCQKTFDDFCAAFIPPRTN